MKNGIGQSLSYRSSVCGTRLQCFTPSPLSLVRIQMVSASWLFHFIVRSFRQPILCAQGLCSLHFRIVSRRRLHIYIYIYPLMPGSRLRLSTAQRNSTQLNSSLDWLCALALVIENASLFLTSSVEAQPGGRAKRGEGATFRHFPKPVAIHCRTYCIKLIFRQVCN